MQKPKPSTREWVKSRDKDGFVSPVLTLPISDPPILTHQMPSRSLSGTYGLAQVSLLPWELLGVEGAWPALKSGAGSGWGLAGGGWAQRKTVTWWAIAFHLPLLPRVHSLFILALTTIICYFGDSYKGAAFGDSVRETCLLKAVTSAPAVWAASPPWSVLSLKN